MNTQEQEQKPKPGFIDESDNNEDDWLPQDSQLLNPDIDE